LNSISACYQIIW